MPRRDGARPATALGVMVGGGLRPCISSQVLEELGLREARHPCQGTPRRHSLPSPKSCRVTVGNRNIFSASHDGWKAGSPAPEAEAEGQTFTGRLQGPCRGKASAPMWPKVNPAQEAQMGPEGAISGRQGADTCAAPVGTACTRAQT